MPSPTSNDLRESAARAEDAWDLLNHIAWTDTVKPRLLETREQLSKALVNHLLGSPLPGELTKEQVAGQIYGINFIISTFEGVLTRGKKALDVLNSQGFSL